MNPSNKLRDLKKLMELIEDYKRMVYEYNKLISGTGYHLKPIHIVTRKHGGRTVKYVYVGRYWYKVVYSGKRGNISRVKWIYIGKSKPDSRLPDPPTSPVEGIVLKVVDGKIYMIDRSLSE